MKNDPNNVKSAEEMIREVQKWREEEKQALKKRLRR